MKTKKSKKGMNLEQFIKYMQQQKKLEEEQRRQP